MNSEVLTRRWNLFWAAAAAAAVAVVSVLAITAAIGKPLTLDETDITIRAHYILIKGAQTFLDGTHYIAHPPMIEYVVALIFRLFGEHDYLLRIFGLFISAAVAILVALLVRQILADAPRAARRAAIGVALLLYMSNPLLLQH
ncbi:MAG: glycosyltransferase family 39 protein, partial [Candidatus Omnitrophica bacterium]|nr:glycosyltransferase family 39 protein [Candidatus Omnitrophota bacterium]